MLLLRPFWCPMEQSGQSGTCVPEPRQARFRVNVYLGSFKGLGLNSWDGVLGHSIPPCVNRLRSFHFSGPTSQHATWEAQIALIGVRPKDTHAAMLPDDWRLRQKIIYRCERTQIELITFQKSKADLCTFHICSGISSCQESAYERKLKLGRMAAFGPQGPTSILPGWMTFLICCIATSRQLPVFSQHFLCKCLQWYVIRLRKGGLKHHFKCYLLLYLFLQS